MSHSRADGITRDICGCIFLRGAIFLTAAIRLLSRHELGDGPFRRASGLLSWDWRNGRREGRRDYSQSGGREL